MCTTETNVHISKTRQEGGKKMETGTRAPRKTDKRRRKKRSCDEGRGGVVMVVCIPINQAACLLHWLDPLTLAVAGASWSPAFLQQTKDSASCSTRSITASLTPAAKAERERRTQKLPSSSQLWPSKPSTFFFLLLLLSLKCPRTHSKKKTSHCRQHIARLVKSRQACAHKWH